MKPNALLRFTLCRVAAALSLLVGACAPTQVVQRLPGEVVTVRVASSFPNPFAVEHKAYWTDRSDDGLCTICRRDENGSVRTLHSAQAAIALLNVSKDYVIWVEYWQGSSGASGGGQLHWHLYSMDVATGNEHPIADNESQPEVEFPSTDLSGKYLVYDNTIGPHPSEDLQISVYDLAAGANLKRIHIDGFDLYSPTIDGTRIVFCKTQHDQHITEGSELALYDLATDSVSNLVLGAHLYQPQLRNGLLVYNSDQQNGWGTIQLYDLTAGKGRVVWPPDKWPTQIVQKWDQPVALGGDQPTLNQHYVVWSTVRNAPIAYDIANQRYVGLADQNVQISKPRACAGGVTWTELPSQQDTTTILKVVFDSSK